MSLTLLLSGFKHTHISPLYYVHNIPCRLLLLSAELNWMYVINCWLLKMWEENLSFSPETTYIYIIKLSKKQNKNINIHPTRSPPASKSCQKIFWNSFCTPVSTPASNIPSKVVSQKEGRWVCLNRSELRLQTRSYWKVTHNIPSCLHISRKLGHNNVFDQKMESEKLV